jgi:hypothetical protein
LAGFVSHRASQASPKASVRPVDRASRPESHQRLFPIPNTHPHFRLIDDRFSRKTDSTVKTGGSERLGDTKSLDAEKPVATHRRLGSRDRRKLEELLDFSPTRGKHNHNA